MVSTLTSEAVIPTSEQHASIATVLSRDSRVIQSSKTSTLEYYLLE